MGGLAGHMMHPYEDTSLTFSDIHQMIDDVSSGNVSSLSEKIDGQNIMFSWIDNELRFARNKTQVKNFGEKSMNVHKIIEHFNNPLVTDVFTSAFNDIKVSLSSLGANRIYDIFENGRFWINCEIVNSKLQNIIPYPFDMIVFHNIKEYDESGELIGLIDESDLVIDRLITDLKSRSDQVESMHELSSPIRLTLIHDRVDYHIKHKLSYSVHELQEEFKLKETDTLGTYQERWFARYLKSVIPIPPAILSNILNRWVYSDRSFRLNSTTIPNQIILNKIKNIESDDLKRIREEMMEPIELLFLSLGAYVIPLYEGYEANVTYNVDGVDMVEQFKSAHRTLYNSDDPSILKLLSRNLYKLQAIGGIDSIYPTEGIVFQFKDKFYKLTAHFAPVNQIIGKVKFG